MDRNEFYKQKLTEARKKLEKSLATLTEEQWQTVIISEGQAWTVQDIVAHLLENEQAMSIHVHKIRKGRETVPAGFDLEKWNAGLKDRMPAATPAELLQGLAKARVKTLEILATIEENEWELQGYHPLRQQISIAQYYETMAGHDTWHNDDIRRGLGLD